MSSHVLKLLSASRASDELAALRPESTFAEMVSTSDYKPIDQARDRALAALTQAYQSGAMPMAEWSGELSHAEPPEKLKQYFPEAKRVAWRERARIKAVAFEALAETGQRIGCVWLLALSKGEANKELGLSLWFSAPGKQEMLHYRGAQKEMPNFPDPMGALISMSNPDFVGAQLAGLEKEELERAAPQSSRVREGARPAP